MTFHFGTDFGDTALQRNKSASSRKQRGRKRPGPKEAAERPRKTGEDPEIHPAGAKAHDLLSAAYGTTEVVP
jgi:hypothetical protein